MTIELDEKEAAILDRILTMTYDYIDSLEVMVGTYDVAHGLKGCKDVISKVMQQYAREH